jgi:hypothetical protein
MSNWKIRYAEAHYKHTLERTPSVVKDGLYCEPKYPDVKKSGGLTLMICNYINWMGWRATRINTMGRQIGSKWIKGTTRRGSSDVSSTVVGRSIMWEVKVGKDKPSDHQLAEQAKERKAGGEYYFVHTPEEFFLLLDEFLNRI